MDFSGDPRGTQGLHAYCRKCQAIYNSAYHLTPRGRALVLIHSAARRKPVTVTREWIAERIERGVCEATGIKFDMNPRADGVHQNPLAPSLDRMDPAGDYTPDNTQVVIFAYNTAKGQLKDPEARDLIKRMGAGL